jgi:hypothetical protein
MFDHHLQIPRKAMLREAADFEHLHHGPTHGPVLIDPSCLAPVCSEKANIAQLGLQRLRCGQSGVAAKLT